jgi:predicted metal-dependent phosphoesterase TrpH
VFVVVIKRLPLRIPHYSRAGLCDAALQRLSDVKAGLGAIEVGHTDHSPDITKHYSKVANNLGLIPTAGSDFHRFDPEKESSFGLVTVDYDIVERLRSASEYGMNK